MQTPSDDSSTRQSLMDQIRDRANAVAWQRYWQTYHPKIRQWCASSQLKGDELDEVVSMVLAKIVKTMEAGWAYDPRRTYRGWLWRVCYSQVKEFLERKAGSPAKGTGASDVMEQLLEQPAPCDADNAEAEFAALVVRATEGVKESLGEDSVKWRSFQMTAIEDRWGKQVAEALGISVGLVHQNKSRVAAEIRAQVERLRDNDNP